MSQAQDQGELWEVMPHQLQVVSFLGNNTYGRAEFDESTLRVYKCYIQRTDRMQWSAQGINHGMPFTAWVLSIPINGTTPVPFEENDQFTVLVPNDIEIRRLGSINSYYDQFNNLSNMVVGFQ